MSAYTYFPIKPLRDRLSNMGLTTNPVCSKAVGISPRVWTRWCSRGMIPAFQHDEVAVRLGLEPEEIWDEDLIETYWYQRSLDRPSRRKK